MIRQYIGMSTGIIFKDFSYEIAIKYIGKRKWKLLEDFTVKIKMKNSEITIPKGFITDKASIPRIAFTLFPRSVSYDFASIIHDYLYEEKMWTRKDCDKIFKSFLKLAGVSNLKVNTMYHAVRVGGYFRYKRKKK